MRQLLLSALLVISTGLCAAQTIAAGDQSFSSIVQLQQKEWIHGAEDCELNEDPAIDVFRYDQSSYILRQNKCLSYEAPFIYVLFGEEKVLVLDTGATENESEFPLYRTVRSLIDEQSAQDGNTERELLVLHTHGHSDHFKGDSQFAGKPNVTIINPDADSIVRFFGFSNWPQGEASVELGGRTLAVFPTPGHQEEAISFYDPHTKWLLTGDTFYPGYIYVKVWKDYRNSIARLAAFSATHEVDAVLGSHIEMMNKAGKYYTIGTIYQPDEASLVLSPEQLAALNSRLSKLKRPKKVKEDGFIVAPMSFFQKKLSNMVRWINN